jgi:hypothetical protein
MEAVRGNLGRSEASVAYLVRQFQAGVFFMAFQDLTAGRDR